MKTLTYGVLPSAEEFYAAFDRECPRGLYNIGGGALFRPPTWYPPLGDYSKDQLRKELWRLLDCDETDAMHEGVEDSPTSLVGDILFTLGFEWI